MTNTQYDVEVRLKDSSTPHHYDRIDSVHEEGSYTVLFTHDRIYRIPTSQIFRLRLVPCATTSPDCSKNIPSL